MLFRLMLEGWLEPFLAMIGTCGAVGSMALRRLRGDGCVSLLLKAAPKGLSCDSI